MRLLALVAVLGLTTPAFFQTDSQNTYPLWYDTLYDNPQTTLSSVACSGYGDYTFGELPTYPAIGGIPMIDGWDSPNCGTCWQLTYTDARGNSCSTLFAAINVGDQNPDGFITSLETMNYLMDGNAEIFDGDTINVVQMPESNCGM